MLIEGQFYYSTEVEAQREGERTKAFMGPGYDYSFTVWWHGVTKEWVLDFSYYQSCD